MTVLILFASLEGQTRKIAQFAADRVRAAGQDVRMCDLSAEPVPVDYDVAAKVILAAPVHERRHPQTFETVLARDQGDLSALPVLFLSVSLKAAFEEGLESAADFALEMKMRTGLTPTAECLVAGALRPAGYDYFARQVLRNVVLPDHRFDPDQTHEFTDWSALRSCIDGFLAA